MVALVRASGVLVLVFGLLGVAATSVGRDMQMSVPTLGDATWATALRVSLDYAVYVLLGLGGLSLARLRPGRRVLVAAFVASAVRLAHDVAATDFETARDQTIWKGDVVAVAVAVGALGLSFVAARRAPRES